MFKYRSAVSSKSRLASSGRINSEVDAALDFLCVRSAVVVIARCLSTGSTRYKGIPMNAEYNDLHDRETYIPA